MPAFYPSVPEDLMAWCLKQRVFWTASAPLHGAHINVSPKGLFSSAFVFRGGNAAAYVDLGGSGVETIAHVKENGRVTVLFSSFDAGPRIVRLFCRGRVVERCGGATFDAWMRRFGEDAYEKFPAARAVIVLDIFKVQTSCGYGVPLLALEPAPDDAAAPKPCLADRQTVLTTGAHMVASGRLDEYQATFNARSLDGLPGLASAAPRGPREALRRAVAAARRHERDACLLLAGVVLGIAVVSAGRVAAA